MIGDNRIKVKRRIRAFCIYSIPVAMVSVLLWLFGPTWYWQAFHSRSVASIKVDIEWKDVTLNEATLRMNDLFAENGIRVRAEVRGCLEDKDSGRFGGVQRQEFGITGSEIPLSDLCRYISQLQQCRVYGSYNTIYFDHFWPEHWSLRRRVLLSLKNQTSMFTGRHLKTASSLQEGLNRL